MIYFYVLFNLLGIGIYRVRVRLKLGVFSDANALENKPESKSRGFMVLT